jgi:hypothetical protein
MNRFFVYALVDPRNQQPFYIGKGCGERPKKHLTETLEQTDNVRKFYKIQALREAGVEPTILKLKEDLSEVEAFQFEEEQIRYYGRKGLEPDGILTNLVFDNQPPSRIGRKHSEATKLKISQSMTGKPKSSEHRANIGAAKAGENSPHWGQPVPEERKAKIRQGNLGKKRSEDVRRNMAQAHAVKYEVISPEGKRRILDSLMLQKLCDSMGLNKTSFTNSCRAGRTYKGWGIKRL